MPESMTRYERLEAAWNLQEADRVPVAPILVYMLPYQAGMTIQEMLTRPDLCVQAALDHPDLIGDNVHPMITTLDHLSLLGSAGWDMTTLDWRVWDQFPPEGNIPSLYEKSIIDDYEDVLARGFSTLLFNQKLENEIFHRSAEEFLWYHFEYPGEYAQHWRAFVEQTSIPLLMGGRACHPLDLLQYYRGINQLTMDIFEAPGLVHRMCAWLAEYEAARVMRRAMDMGAGEVPGAEVIFFYNGGPPGMSPEIFDEFYYPYAKQMVDIFVGRGFKVWNHWDNDQTPYLETIRNITDGLPLGRVLMDFEKTDMREAKRVLGDRVCLYGNVPSALLVYGEPGEVEEHCRGLIEECAQGGGYILGSECEVPWDAKPENVRAMIAAAEKYGGYADLREDELGDRQGAAPREEGSLLAGVKSRLDPPTREELDQITARWLFGDNAERMMAHAPWSFVLTKLMWKPGEAPWESEARGS